MKRSSTFFLSLLPAVFAIQGIAATIDCGKNAACPGSPVAGAGSFTSVLIPEGVKVTLPMQVRPGGIDVCEPNVCVESDIIWFFPDGFSVELFTPLSDTIGDPDTEGGGLDILPPPGVSANSGGAVIESSAAGGVEQITFNTCDATGTNCNTYNMTSDTPEPSSLLLLGSGLLAVILMVRYLDSAKILA